jgi:hypothetical protein
LARRSRTCTSSSDSFTINLGAGTLIIIPGIQSRIFNINFTPGPSQVFRSASELQVLLPRLGRGTLSVVRPCLPFLPTDTDHLFIPVFHSAAIRFVVLRSPRMQKVTRRPGSCRPGSRIPPFIVRLHPKFTERRRTPSKTASPRHMRFAECVPLFLPFLTFPLILTVPTL